MDNGKAVARQGEDSKDSCKNSGSRPWAAVPAVVAVTGMVQAWVGHFVTPLKCTHDEYN
jgi:hypothetical protein